MPVSTGEAVSVTAAGAELSSTTSACSPGLAAIGPPAQSASSTASMLTDPTPSGAPGARITGIENNVPLELGPHPGPSNAMSTVSEPSGFVTVSIWLVPNRLK